MARRRADKALKFIAFWNATPLARLAMTACRVESGVAGVKAKRRGDNIFVAALVPADPQGHPYIRQDACRRLTLR